MRKINKSFNKNKIIKELFFASSAFLAISALGVNNAKAEEVIVEKYKITPDGIFKVNKGVSLKDKMKVSSKGLEFKETYDLTEVLYTPQLTPKVNNLGIVETQSVFQPTKLEVDRINFKAEGRSAKLTIDFNENNVEPKIVKTDDLLIIDLPNITIPAEFQQNVSTKRAGSVVKNLDIATRNESGRIVLSQDEPWNFHHYQMDNKLVIEIKPNIDTTDLKYKGKPLTLNFQNMDVRAIIQVLADFTGLNIITSDLVTGAMTIRLTDVPWDQALDLILESNNLRQEKNGNVIWIATSQEVAEKNKTQLEISLQEEALAPLKLRFFQLNHYKAEDMKNIIEGNNAGGKGDFRFLSQKGTVGLDPKNNTIFVQDVESKLEEISKIVGKLDVASKQILIEAKLVVVDDKFQRDIGAKFGAGYGRRKGNTDYAIGNSIGDNLSMIDGGRPSGTMWDGPVKGGGSIGFTILNAISGNLLNIELSALEEENRGKVISSPKLLTVDNRKAEIRQGTQIPYVMPGSNDQTPTVQFKDAVLSLGVTPQVSANGRVTLDLDIKKDTVGQLVNVQGGGQVPSIDTRSINTQVTINDGQTVVLGGIYEVTSRDDISKVPFFGDIPWIGNLFKTKSKSNDKVELLIFITPHIVYDEDLDRINSFENQNNEFTLEKK